MTKAELAARIEALEKEKAELLRMLGEAQTALIRTVTPWAPSPWPASPWSAPPPPPPPPLPPNWPFEPPQPPLFPYTPVVPTITTCGHVQ